MEDIGGCRAVVPGLQELRLLADLILAQIEMDHSMTLRDDLDYVATPKASGYRGRHLIARVHDHLIEIQIRTERQERWAQAVEDALGRTGFNVKDEQAPEQLLLYFKQAALRLALEDEGHPADKDLERKFANLRELIRPLYSRS
jgi:putative GTP pyrophosphokinase